MCSASSGASSLSASSPKSSSSGVGERLLRLCAGGEFGDVRLLGQRHPRHPPGEPHALHRSGGVGVQRRRTVVRIGVRALPGVDDVGDHDGDVVRPAAAQGQLDQPIGGVGGVVAGQGVGDGFGGDHPGQAVGADQVSIADADLAVDQARLDVGAVDRAQQQRPLRVDRGLRLGDATLVDQRLDEGVVVGDLGEHPGPPQVRPGVADVSDAEPAAVEQQGRDGGAHPLEIGVLGDHVGDRLIAVVGGVLQRGQQVAAARLVVVQRRERGDRQSGRGVPGGVPAHPVGNDEQPVPGVHGVLVVRPEQAAVGACRIAQGVRHRPHRAICAGRPCPRVDASGAAVAVTASARTRCGRSGWVSALVPAPAR